VTPIAKKSALSLSEKNFSSFPTTGSETVNEPSNKASSTNSRNYHSSKCGHIGTCNANGAPMVNVTKTALLPFRKKQFG
jgi:hypothetical protein